MTDYDQLYREDPAVCGTPYPEYKRFFKEHKDEGLKVLDLGCGQGRDALMIARLGHTVTGVDLSPAGIEQMTAAAREEKLKVHGIVADLIEYIPEEEYDAVVLDRSLHMIKRDEDKAVILDKADDCLRDGGYMLIADIPSNMPLIEGCFAPVGGWEQVYKKKGFRFYKKTEG